MASRLSTGSEPQPCTTPQRKTPATRQAWVIFLAGSFVLGSGFAVRSYLRHGGASGSVTIEPAAFDFGEVEQGQTLTHTFTVTNDTDAAIELAKVVHSCGCTTTARLEGRVIGPGESLDVPVTLKTEGKADALWETVTLYYRKAGTSAPPMRFADARVQANVLPDYVVRPTLLDFGTVDHLNPVTKTLRLRPCRLANVKITDFDCRHPAFSARQVEAPPGESDLYAEVTFSGVSLWKSGPVTGRTLLRTTSRGAPTTEILLRAQFQAPVEVEPSSVVIGSEISGSVVRELRISAVRPVRIMAMRCPVVDIKLASTSEPDATEHRVTVTIGGNNPRQPINSEIQMDIASMLATDATEVRTVTIPIHRLALRERTGVR